MSTNVVVVDDERQLARTAAEIVADAMRAAISSDGVFRLALAGGSTPRLVHGVLAEEPRYRALPWSRVDVFWGDERTVPPDHPDSNYRMALDTLLSKVPIDPSRVFRIPADDPDPHRAADRYEQVVRAAFDVQPPILPRFDLILLGVGADGHTASLFPSSPTLLERERLVVASWAEALSTWRVTLTLPVINAAAQVTFMVSGAAKAAAVAATLEPPAGSTPPPAALVQPVDGRVTWVLDAPAARFLRSAS
jgi:6-phosphogluconolactonase